MARKNKNHKYFGTDGRTIVKQERDTAVVNALEAELAKLERASKKALTFPKE